MCGSWNKWRGVTVGPRGRGRAQGGGRALDPRGQVLAPLPCSQCQIFSYIPEKKSYLIFRAFGELLFSGNFLLH